ncbi:oligosaccharide flippase family protein [Shewanella vesiculosa]|uniref:oligosaccharide flippase family protein n=1 Tax=Shewanella vesiculosa TaxID=518738 RepID=UPI003D01437B
MIEKFKRLSPSHPIWVVLNQFFTKALMAIKFFIAAKYLGPEYMGVIGVVLLIYAISESITEFGLIHALIQEKEEPSDKDLDFIWWALFFRGGILAIFLVVIGFLIPMGQHANIFAMSCIIIAISAWLKSSVSVDFYLIQRKRIFNKIFFIASISAITDIVITFYLLFEMDTLLSIFFGLMGAEVTKFILSYLFLKSGFRLFCNPLLNVKKYTDFGKWIWASNLLTLFLNQSDKLITGALLGVTQLGIYQMSGRLAQLGISDLAVAFGQYLFPSFSRLNKDSPEQRDLLLVKSIAYMLVFSISNYILVFALSDLVPIILGNEWKDTVITLKILSLSMVNGAIISVLVAYFRAIGLPKKITQSAIIQLVIFIPALIILTHLYGIVGTAISAVVGTITCLIVLFHGLNVKLIPNLYEYLHLMIKLLVFILVITVAIIFSSLFYVSLISTTGYIAMLLSIYYHERKALV